MAEQTITIRLSKAQRDILFKYQKDFSDVELAQLLSLALKKGGEYEFHLTEEQLDDLVNELCAVSNHTKNRKVKGEVDKLCEHFEAYLPDPETEFREKYSKYSKNIGNVYILKVALERDKKVWRKIAIRGGQTLQDLHDVIYDAFDRDDEHLYSYYIPAFLAKSRTNKVMRTAKEYTHPYSLSGDMFDNEASNAAETSIESLYLSTGQKFFYIFDFGDSWWHEITVEETNGTPDGEKYPRIVQRQGESPPQYAWEGDGEDADEEE